MCRSAAGASIRSTKPVWTDEPDSGIEGASIGESDNCTGPLFNLIERNFPQSNVTWPNKSNVVTVCPPVCPPARPPDSSSHFCPKKKRLSPAKNFNSLSVCNENKSQQRSIILSETSVNFPPENSLRPLRVSESHSFQFTDGGYVIM